METINTNKGLIAWFARNHVAANLLMVVIILTGVFSAMTIRTQMFPDLEIERVSIDVAFPGAAPGEVESGVVSRLEEAVLGRNGGADEQHHQGVAAGEQSLMKILRNLAKVNWIIFPFAIDEYLRMVSDPESPYAARKLEEELAFLISIGRSTATRPLTQPQQKWVNDITRRCQR